MNPVLCSKTLAHELAHNLGAVHTTHAWREGWWIFKVWVRDLEW